MGLSGKVLRGIEGVERAEEEKGMKESRVATILVTLESSGLRSLCLINNSI